MTLSEVHLGRPGDLTLGFSLSCVFHTQELSQLSLKQREMFLNQVLTTSLFLYPGQHSPRF